MAFNKNRKRAIGIIASYLLGLSSSSGVFIDHKVSYCNTHKKIFHPETGEKCCNGGIIERLSCKAYQQCDHFVNGLHFFKRGDKIFYCLVRDNNYEFVYNKQFSDGENFINELKQFDKTLFTGKELKTWYESAKDNHTKLFFKFLENCYNKALNEKGEIYWCKIHNDNPLDFCAIHIPSAESFAERLGKKTHQVKLTECFSKTCTDKITNVWYINHGSNEEYDILLSSEEMKKRGILSKKKENDDLKFFLDTLGIESSNTDLDFLDNSMSFDREILRNTNFVFFFLNNDKNTRTLLDDTSKQFYIRKRINRIPLMYVSRDCISDGKTSDLPLNFDKDLPIWFGDGLGVLKEFIGKGCQSITDVVKTAKIISDGTRIEVRIPGPIYTFGKGTWGNNSMAIKNIK